MILLDELGRSTAAEEGAALTWTVCEHLLKRGCLTLAATHYQQCGRMAEMYHQAAKLVWWGRRRGRSWFLKGQRFVVTWLVYWGGWVVGY